MGVILLDKDLLLSGWDIKNIYWMKDRDIARTLLSCSSEREAAFTASHKRDLKGFPLISEKK